MIRQRRMDNLSHFCLPLQPLGYFQGALYGPNANEIGGSFGFQTEATDGFYGAPSATATTLAGVVVGKRTN